MSRPIPLHTGLSAEHVRQALDYRQASEGDALSARYEAESFRAARKAAYLADEDDTDRLPPIATLALCVAAWALLGMLAWGLLKMLGLV